MATKLKQILADLPPARRKRIETRYGELKQDVESLGELRRIAGKVQADIATALGIKQPSVSKIEKQTDMYLSTLRSYVEAVGGKLEVTVRFPKQRVLQLRRLGEVLDPPPPSPKSRARSRGTRP